MGEYLSIKVSIANRTYPLRITREEHDRVLEAADHINKRIREFEDSFAIKDKQDLLAMCALQFANEAMGHHKSEKNESLKDVNDHIQRLSFMIDEHLAKETPAP
jgi:cell division protein ZapA